MAMARRLPAGLAGYAPIIPTFTLAGEFQLTDVKLIRLDELKEKVSGAIHFYGYCCN